MGAACCSDKYLVPQNHTHQKGDPDYGDAESVLAVAGEDEATHRPEQKYQAKHYVAQAWGDEVAEGVIAGTTLSKMELVHFRPHPGQEDPSRKKNTPGRIQENIDPWVLGNMTLTDFKRGASSKEHILQLDELKHALASDNDTRTISQVLKYNAIHNWIVQVPFRVEAISIPDVEWENCFSDDEVEADEPWSSRGGQGSDGFTLSTEVLAEHNARVLKVEKSKLSMLVSQSKSNFFAEKSDRIVTLMEAMAAAIDPSLSSNTRRDDCVFSSVLSSENQSQPGARCSSRESDRQRGNRRHLNSRSSSQSSKTSETPQGVNSFNSPGKADSRQGGFNKQRSRKHNRGSFDREREDLDQCFFLICDDNDVNCQIVSCILKKLCPCKCVITHDGFQAVDTFSSHPPHYFRAIFMDIHMPECDGVTATRMIRQKEKEIALSGAEGGILTEYRTPIIGITADSDAKVQAQCLEAGTNRVLLKPTRKEDVFEALVQFNVLDRQSLQLVQPLQVVEV